MSEDLSGLSFSSSWNWRNSRVGRKIVEEILSLGFASVELNYHVSEEMLETIEPMVARGELRVSSVHNVFPEIEDRRFDTDSRLLGYEDEELRRQAVALALRSAERGSNLGAKAVVVHPGVVPIDPNSSPTGLSGEGWDARFRGLYERGFRKGDAQYDAALQDFAALRASSAPPELERVARSLEEIAEGIERQGLGIAIGIENRPMCWQIPDFAEMDYLLKRLEGAKAGMWLDTGHGALMRHLGFFDDLAEASSLAPRLVGVHIHDVAGIEDHFSPYTREGQDDYLGLIEASPIKVIEIGPKNSRDAAMRGAEALARELRARREGTR